MIRSVARVILLCLLWRAPGAEAVDLTTLSGTTYRDVNAVRVEPDGITWEHATGLVKIDFPDLPEAVRKAYHYDAGKAAAFQAAQARTRAEFAARMQRTQREIEERRSQQNEARALSGPKTVETQPGQFVYRRRAADAALVESAQEGIAAKQAAEILRTKDDGTLWDRRLWALPRLITGGYSDGTNFDPKTNLNSREYQASLHSAEGISQGDYMTKSYNQDVDRAAAFARGKPLP